ncbi:MAG: hypothetical protein GYA35_01195 [Thermoanaerobaculaceae bacterium]|nr:hypothetical protein [Thermoanaerobaculaceae bacterium]
MREAISGTGFTCYRLKSDIDGRRGLIVVPENYHEKASYLTKYSIAYKAVLHPDMDRKILEDMVYLGNCLSIADEEMKSKEKSVRENGKMNFKFFKALLDGLEREKKSKK